MCSVNIGWVSVQGAGPLSTMEDSTGTLAGRTQTPGPQVQGEWQDKPRAVQTSAKGSVPWAAGAWEGRQCFLAQWGSCLQTLRILFPVSILNWFFKSLLVIKLINLPIYRFIYLSVSLCIFNFLSLWEPEREERGIQWWETWLRRVA